MISKKGQAVSEENLEKVSGGKVIPCKVVDETSSPPKVYTVYKVIYDRTGKCVQTFESLEIAKQFDKLINSTKNDTVRLYYSRNIPLN